MSEIRRSDLNVTCAGCGNTWGQHFGESCYPPGHERHGNPLFSFVRAVPEPIIERDPTVGADVRFGGIGQDDGAMLDEVCLLCGRRRGSHWDGKCYPPYEYYTAVPRDQMFVGTGVFIHHDNAPYFMNNYISTREGGTAMDRVCSNCGLRYGWHRAQEPNLCPVSTNDWNYERGPGTSFLDSGLRRSEDSYSGNTRAANLPELGVDDPFTAIATAPAATAATPAPEVSFVAITPTTQPMDGWDGWIMLHGADHQFTRLLENGVPVVPATIVDYGGMTGIAFPASDLEKVRGLFSFGTILIDTLDPSIKLAVTDEGLKLLNDKAERMAKVAAGMEVLRSSRAAVPTVPTPTEVKPEDMYDVRAESKNDLEALEQIRPLLKQFALENKVTITLKNFSSSAWDKREPAEGALRILFWTNASPVGVNGYRRSQVYGLNLADGQRDGCEESYMADWTIYDPEQVPVAEVMGRTLFILFDLPHYRGNAEAILRRILEDYKKGKLDADNTDNSVQHEKMFALMDSVGATVVAKIQQEVTSYQASVDKLYRQLESYVSQLMQSKAALAMITSADKTDARKRAADAYEALAGLQHVKKVVVTGSLVFVFTEHLNFFYKDNWYLGHSYKIRLDVRGGSLQILSNDNNPCHEGFPHPHVGNGGGPCLGNIQKGIYKYLADMEFAPLIVTLIGYLQTVNEGDWYHNPRYWKVLKKVPGFEIGANTTLKEWEDASAGITGAASATAATVTVTPAQPVANPDLWICPNCGTAYDSEVDADPCTECGNCNACCDGDHDGYEDDDN